MIAPVSRSSIQKPAASALALPVPSGVPSLKKGDSGTGVKQIQDALKQLGFMTAAAANTGPGTFGPLTDASLKRFQTSAKLTPDGVFGPKTSAALKKALGGVIQTPPGTTFKKPPVISAPSPNFGERNGAKIDTIVIHHTASNNGAGDLAHMRDPKSQVSAHYMLDRDGKIYQLVNDSKRAWHAGKGELHGVPTDVNGRSIGIEIVNDGSGKTPFTEAQYKSLTQLVGFLKREYNVPGGNIVGHKDVAVPKGRKNDPAANFDWQRLRAGI
jgi:N-acetylmuramoyl-L-alanine amidase